MIDDSGLPYDDVTGASCPSCGYAFDSATVVGSVQVPPSPGDYSICIKCAYVGEWYADDDRAMRVRAPWTPVPQEVLEMAARVSYFNKVRGD